MKTQDYIVIGASYDDEVAQAICDSYDVASKSIESQITLEMVDLSDAILIVRELTRSRQSLLEDDESV